jgi:hypothetical protein
LSVRAEAIGGIQKFQVQHVGAAPLAAPERLNSVS